MGIISCDIHAVAIAVAMPGASGGYGLVGTNSISISNGSTTDSCNATISTGAAVYGRMVCNSIAVNGGAIHYDTSLPSVGTTTYGSFIELAK